MKYAIAQMMKQEPRSSGDRGWIVNISSIGGVVGLSMERMLAVFHSTVSPVHFMITVTDAQKRLIVRAKVP